MRCVIPLISSKTCGFGFNIKFNHFNPKMFIFSLARGCSRAVSRTRSSSQTSPGSGWSLCTGSRGRTATRGRGYTARWSAAGPARPPPALVTCEESVVRCESSKSNILLLTGHAKTLSVVFSLTHRVWFLSVLSDDIKENIIKYWYNEFPFNSVLIMQKVYRWFCSYNCSFELMFLFFYF